MKKITLLYLLFFVQLSFAQDYIKNIHCNYNTGGRAATIYDLNISGSKITYSQYTPYKNEKSEKSMANNLNSFHRLISLLDIEEFESLKDGPQYGIIDGSDSRITIQTYKGRTITKLNIEARNTLSKKIQLFLSKVALHSSYFAPRKPVAFEKLYDDSRYYSNEIKENRVLGHFLINSKKDWKHFYKKLKTSLNIEEIEEEYEEEGKEIYERKTFIEDFDFNNYSLIIARGNPDRFYKITETQNTLILHYSQTYRHGMRPVPSVMRGLNFEIFKVAKTKKAVLLQVDNQADDLVTTDSLSGKRTFNHQLSLRAIQSIDFLNEEEFPFDNCVESYELHPKGTLTENRNGLQKCTFDYEILKNNKLKFNNKQCTAEKTAHLIDPVQNPINQFMQYLKKHQGFEDISKTNLSFTEFQNHPYFSNFRWVYDYGLYQVFTITSPKNKHKTFGSALIYNVLPQSLERNVLEAENYFSNFMNTKSQYTMIGLSLPTHQIGYDRIFKYDYALKLYQQQAKTQRKQIAETVKNEDYKNVSYKDVKVIAYPYDLLVKETPKLKDVLHKHITLYKVIYYKEKGDKYGSRYKFFVKDGERWVFFKDIFKTLKL